MKAYAAWVGPDNRLRLRKATLSTDGVANVRRGPQSVKVDPQRSFTYRGKTCFFVPGDRGEAIDVWGKSRETMTSEGLNELINNNYAAQVLTELNRGRLGQHVRDWLLIGAIAVLLLIQIWAFNETKDAINDVARIITERFPSQVAPT